MNNLVGKIFEDRKNNTRKVVVVEHNEVSGTEVVSIKFLDGCGKKAGTTENKLLKSFKKSWKEIEEVIEKVVEEPEQVEEVVVETEENLSDEDYVKIGVEIAKQANKKVKKKSITVESKIDEVSSAVMSFGLDIKTYSGRLNNLNIKKDGKNVLEICVKRNRLVIYSKNELSIDCEHISNGKYKAFIEYTENYIHEVNKLLGGI